MRNWECEVQCMSIMGRKYCNNDHITAMTMAMMMMIDDDVDHEYHNTVVDDCCGGVDDDNDL